MIRECCGHERCCRASKVDNRHACLLDCTTRAGEPKRKYATRGAAVVATRYAFQNTVAGSGGQFYPYECPACGKWHVGHRPVVVIR